MPPAPVNSVSPAPAQPAALASKPAAGARWVLAPVLIFLALAGMFAFALQKGDPSKLPSALIGRPAPALTLPPLDGLVENGQPIPGFGPAELATGAPTVVNFWASWCQPCVDEHAMLVRLAQLQGVTLVGINYKDQASNARRFLSRYGNPFARVGVDRDGRAAIEWGVYGTPETFVVDGRGKIVFKHVGPITPETLQAQVLPALKRAQAQP